MLAIDWIDWLYERYEGDSDRADFRLAQYLFRLRTPEKTVFKEGGMTRKDCKEIYTKLQGAIFGDDEVAALTQDLRDFINEKPMAKSCVPVSAELQEFKIHSTEVDQWRTSCQKPPSFVMGNTVSVRGEVLDKCIIITGAAENLIAFLKAVATFKEKRDFNTELPAYEPFFSTIRILAENDWGKRGRIDDSQLDIAWFDRFYIWVDDGGRVFLTYHNNGDNPEIERITAVFEEAVGSKKEGKAGIAMQARGGSSAKTGDKRRERARGLIKWYGQLEPGEKAWIDKLAARHGGSEDVKNLLAGARRGEVTAAEIAMAAPDFSTGKSKTDNKLSEKAIERTVNLVLDYLKSDPFYNIGGPGDGRWRKVHDELQAYLEESEKFSIASLWSGLHDAITAVPRPYDYHFRPAEGLDAKVRNILAAAWVTAQYDLYKAQFSAVEAFLWSKQVSENTVTAFRNNGKMNKILKLAEMRRGQLDEKAQHLKIRKRRTAKPAAPEAPPAAKTQPPTDYYVQLTPAGKASIDLKTEQYRNVADMQAIRNLMAGAGLGKIKAADITRILGIDPGLADAIYHTAVTDFVMMAGSGPFVEKGTKAGANTNDVLRTTSDEIAADLPLRAVTFKATLMKMLTDNPDQLFFMGAETDIGGSQKSRVMPMVKDVLNDVTKDIINEIKNMKDAKGKSIFPNLMVGRGSANDLVEMVRKLANDDERNGILKDYGLPIDEDNKLNFSLNNVFIGAKNSSVTGGAYNTIKFEDNRDGAWISAIEDSRDGDYLPVFEAVTLSMMAYAYTNAHADIEPIKTFYDAIANEPKSLEELRAMINNHIIYILPKMTMLNGKELGELYELARHFYISA